MRQVGAAHHNAKLTEDQVRAIREQHGKACPHCGKRTSMADLGKIYGVSTVAIRNIIHRYDWKHVQ